MASHLAKLFGTEEDKVNCPFFYKMGACRHGAACDRKHHHPTSSPTIMLPHLYQNPLAALYASDLDDATKLQRKATLMAAMRAAHTALKARPDGPWAGFTGYDGWFNRATNASLALQAREGPGRGCTEAKITTLSSRLKKLSLDKSLVGSF